MLHIDDNHGFKAYSLLSYPALRWVMDGLSAILWALSLQVSVRRWSSRVARALDDWSQEQEWQFIPSQGSQQAKFCLLYTSDAADE